MECKNSGDETSGGDSSRGPRHKGRWAKERPVEALPAFGVLRGLPPHLLLAALKRELMCHCTGAAASHFQGLAQASRRLGLDSRIAAKMRLVDDSHHLMEHLSPESATIFLREVQASTEQAAWSVCGDSDRADRADLDSLAGFGYWEAAQPMGGPVATGAEMAMDCCVEVKGLPLQVLGDRIECWADCCPDELQVDPSSVANAGKCVVPEVLEKVPSNTNGGKGEVEETSPKVVGLSNEGKGDVVETSPKVVGLSKAAKRRAAKARTLEAKGDVGAVLGDKVVVEYGAVAEHELAVDKEMIIEAPCLEPQVQPGSTPLCRDVVARRVIEHKELQRRALAVTMAECCAQKRAAEKAVDEAQARRDKSAELAASLVSEIAELKAEKELVMKQASGGMGNCKGRRRGKVDRKCIAAAGPSGLHG